MLHQAAAAAAARVQNLKELQCVPRAQAMAPLLLWFRLCGTNRSRENQVMWVAAVSACILWCVSLVVECAAHQLLAATMHNCA
jgi:hypothetical protein